MDYLEIKKLQSFEKIYCQKHMEAFQSILMQKCKNQEKKFINHKSKFSFKYHSLYDIDQSKKKMKDNISIKQIKDKKNIDIQLDETYDSNEIKNTKKIDETNQIHKQHEQLAKIDEQKSNKDLIVHNNYDDIQLKKVSLKILDDYDKSKNSEQIFNNSKKSKRMIIDPEEPLLHKKIKLSEDFKKKNDEDTPFVDNQEQAKIFERVDSEQNNMDQNINLEDDPKTIKNSGNEVKKLKRVYSDELINDHIQLTNQIKQDVNQKSAQKIRRSKLHETKWINKLKQSNSHFIFEENDTITRQIPQNFFDEAFASTSQKSSQIKDLMNFKSVNNHNHQNKQNLYENTSNLKSLINDNTVQKQQIDESIKQQIILKHTGKPFIFQMSREYKFDKSNDQNWLKSINDWVQYIQKTNT